MVRWALGIGLMCVAGSASASDKIVYAAVPDWVKPAPPIDADKIAADAPALLSFDSQQRMQGGELWSYVDTATRAASTEVLSAIGTINLPWQPASGDLIIHRVEIIRGAEHIDVLKAGSSFTILRREQGLDQRALDGMLTATMPVQGLRVGDVLHVTASFTRRDPTLKGNVQTVAPLLFDPLRVQFARTRLLWPDGANLHWKSYADGAAPVPTHAGGWQDLTIPMPLAKQAEMPKDAPGRYQHLPIIEASSFATWADVAAVMAPLYATDGTIAPGSALVTEVDRIAKAESDPLKRAALALQLVQDKVRYQLMGMDTGNYVPQTPASTWTLRYGDCKAKTLLLLAILHALKVEAEPVLANSRLGDMVPDRLPSAAAFDHILVRATIGGESVWLDGTRGGDRLADIHDTPPLGSVLPVRASGATLMRIAVRPDARPEVATLIDLDETTGVNLPAPFRTSVVVRGGAAQMVRMASVQGSKDDVKAMVDRVVSPYLDGALVIANTITFDDAAGTATIAANGVAYPNWTRDGTRSVQALDVAVAKLEFAPDRARAAWHDIPVAIARDTNYSVRTRIRLPAGGTGFTLDGDQPVADILAGQKVDRTVKRDGDAVVIDTTVQASTGELAASAVADARKRLSLAQAHAPRVLAPAGYPPFWQDVQAAKAAHRFDAVLAAYAKRIADKPAEAVGYTDRAWFLERIYERQRAIDDLTHAIAIDPTVENHLKRAALYAATGDKTKAMADAAVAHQVDPASDPALTQLAQYESDRGDSAGALALLQDRIDAGGKDKAGFLAAKAQVQADGGDKDGAIATIDSAVAASPGKPDLLNSRCWIKGTMNVALDSALKDCTRAIELSDATGAALDSRAMVYFRMNRLPDALADLDAALDQNPDQAGSAYLRGVIRRKSGDAKGGNADLLAARTMAPQLDEEYRKYGIVP